MEPILIALATQLTNLISSTSQEYVSAKLQQAKSTKDLTKAEPIYDELINQLLNDKQEAIRVASQYREQLDKTFLPDTDIEYLENTFAKLVDLFQEDSDEKEPSESDSDNDTKNKKKSILDAKTAEQITSLINTETLKSMQLLGFDFKKALGAPVTDGVRKLIENKFEDINKKSSNSQQNQNTHIPDVYVYRANIYKEIEQGEKIVYFLKIPAYGMFKVRSESITDLQIRAVNALGFLLYQNGWSIENSDFTDETQDDPEAYAHTLLTIDVNYSRTYYGVPEKA